MQEVGEERAPVAAEDLEQVRRRFRQWREQRRRGEHIPAGLWAVAVQLAGRHDPLRVAQELRLDPERLKRRLERVAGSAVVNQPDPRFVELLAMPAAAKGPCECVVELHNGRGAQMRVQLSGQALGGLAGLCAAFLGAA